MAGSADALFRKMVGEWRVSELDLAARPRRKLHPHATLYAYSPHVVPVPPDWPADVCVTGYWFLDGEDWHSSWELKSFIESGEAPVYVGFGSMPGIDPQSLTKLVLEALEKAGKRGVLATGGGAIQVDDAAGQVHVIDGAPHEKLFPLMTACVHHGGAGTTGASLRAGKPSAICPFFGDQPFWGNRVADLGVGPTPVDKRRLSPETLAAAILEATESSTIRQRASALGEAIRAEDGVATAIAFLERMRLLTLPFA